MPLLVQELPEDEFNAEFVGGFEPDLEEAEEEPEITLDEDSASFLHDLILRILTFLEYFCDEELYPYQRDPAYRLIESVLLNDGDEVTVLMSRQAGKSTLVADVIATLMVLLPRLAKQFEMLAMFRKGFQVGVFGPIAEQAETIWGRVKDRLQSERAKEIFADPEIDDKTVSGGARTVRLRECGSFCRYHTANPKAKIESKSYHWLVLDEAQDIDDYVSAKSIFPMGAHYNASRVLTGTPTRQKNLYYKAIQRNKRRDLNGRRRKSHFEYNWRVVSKYNPKYKAYVEGEMRRLGPESDEFLLSYECLAPSTKVLTADLRYVPIGDLMPGDKLVGFDEDRQAKGQHRKFRESEVLRTRRIQKPGYRVTLDDGIEVDCSYDHLWLVSTAGRRTLWKKTIELTLSDHIFKVADVWGSAANDYETGYLAAAFDGEGCVMNTRIGNGSAGHVTLTFSQRENAMLDKVCKMLGEKGFSYGVYDKPGSDVKSVVIGGGRAEVLRFLGTIRPERLLARLDPEMWGSIGRHDRRVGGFDHPKVVRVRPLGTIDVIALETTTRTLVAEGLASHNCKWLLDRGMFTTETALEEVMDPSMRIVQAWWQTPVVVGVDPARTKDSTVVTVLWVDWDNPDDMGYYDCRILNWLEIHNEEWETQYAYIAEFLAHYNIWAMAVDAQGVGGAVAERLKLMMAPRGIEVHLLGSDQKAQHERWTHLSQMLERRKIIIPGHSKARRVKVWKKFFQQMTDLEKVAKGPYILAQAPDEEGAYDDYCDSLALACVLTKDVVQAEAEQIEAPWFSRR